MVFFRTPQIGLCLQAIGCERLVNYIAISDRLKTGWDVINFGQHEFDSHYLFFGHGTSNALDEALALAMHVLDCPYEDVDEVMDRVLSKEMKEAILKLYEQRITTRKPAPYLTHTAYFCGLPFYVDERVLIPRSPIAELIENQFVPWVNPDKVKHILELCTGSGCIGIAMAYAFENAKIDATDISSDALTIAEKNCATHQMNGRVQLYQGDLFKPVPKKYDLIVTNPPYVSGTEMESLPNEFSHEPRLALYAPEEGLALVDTILSEAKHYLNEEGVLVVEVGNSEEALVKKYPKVPFIWLSFERGGDGVFLLNYKDLINYF